MNGALRLRKQLPSLLTDCVLVGHARKADVVFTPQQWFEICLHMLNDNPVTFFNMPYRKKDGEVKYAKSLNVDAIKRMLWAWDTITGKAKSPASIGFYPTNPERKSRWAGMDFDAHDGDFMRPRDFGLKAFAIFLQQPQLFVCLTTSAGDPQYSGWHLFVFSREFHLCDEWTRLLKQVAAQIGAPIQDGVCEIFPNEFRGIGKPLRAPGTWNPKTGNCGLILHETLTKGLLPLPSGEDKESNALYILGKLSQSFPRGLPSSASLPSSELFRGKRGEWATKFAITAAGTRHNKVTKLVGTAFYQASREIARKNAELQYREAAPAPVATLQEHLEDFDRAWSGMEKLWKARLSQAERDKFENLATDAQRDAFRILRSWSQTGTRDFGVSSQSLANRLGISLAWACKLRRKFCDLKILRQTRPYVAHKECACFKWIAAEEPKPKQAALGSLSQWHGDPGDAHLRKAKGVK